MLLITPWNRLSDAARYHFPWLPVALLLRDSFDNAAYLAGFPGCVGIIVAEQDDIVPALLGQRLHQELAPDRSRLWSLPGSGHNDWSEQATVASWQRWTAFLQDGLGRRLSPDLNNDRRSRKGCGE